MNKTLRNFVLVISVFAIFIAGFLFMPTVKASAASTTNYSVSYTENAIKLKLTALSSSNKIYYTTNGSKPTASSKRYTKTLSFKKSVTVRAVEINKSGKTVSSIKIKLTPKVAMPKLSIVTRGGSKYIRIREATNGAVIRYTTDGNSPTEESAVFTDLIPISEGSIVIARAFKDGWETSNTALYKHVTKVNSKASEPEQVLEILNEERTSRGLKELKFDSGLCKIAEERAKELVKKFDHTRPNGENVFDMMDSAGIRYSAAGENIAAGQPNAESVMATWMKSEGHRNNILNSKFSRIGIGCCTTSSGYKYWVEVFMN